MLKDLDDTLERLLKNRLPADLSNQVEISFDVPDDESVKQKPAINFFLYDVRENWELRKGNWLMERQENSVTRKRPPVRVDCSYIVTALSAETESGLKSEHELLGEVMKVLLRYPKIPSQELQGSLAGQEPPLRAKVMRDGHLQSLGEFWQAMGSKPKAALNYTITISVPSEIEETHTLVESRENRVMGLEDVEKLFSKSDEEILNNSPSS